MDRIQIGLYEGVARGEGNGRISSPRSRRGILRPKLSDGFSSSLLDPSSVSFALPAIPGFERAVSRETAAVEEYRGAGGGGGGGCKGEDGGSHDPKLLHRSPADSRTPP